jgi:hypothetical protein
VEKDAAAAKIYEREREREWEASPRNIAHAKPVVDRGGSITRLTRRRALLFLGILLHGGWWLGCIFALVCMGAELSSSPRMLLAAKMPPPLLMVSLNATQYG